MKANTMALALVRAGLTKVEEKPAEPRPVCVEDVAEAVAATHARTGAKAIARNVLRRRDELRKGRP